MTSEDIHWFEKATSVIDQNILGVKLGLYGVGLLGLGIALRSVRPFKKLVVASEVPQFFIDGKLKLRGKVVGVDFFPKTLLAIDHEPLLGAKLRKQGRLPVNIEGINITGNGISWLQGILVGNEVSFIILEKQRDFLNCIVYDKKRDVGSYLVSVGFASVAPFNASLDDNDTYKKYYQQLLKMEESAERKRNGIWWDRPQKFRLIDFLLSKMPALKIKTVFRF